jgi:hypothetical protein
MAKIQTDIKFRFIDTNGEKSNKSKAKRLK